MLRCRLLLGLVVFALSLRFLPAAWCGAEADALLRDDRQLQQAMARGVDRWRNESLSADRFMTGNDRFDGEWLFGTYMMAALGYAQVALAHPELAQESVVAMDDCIAHLLGDRARSFDRAAWGSDPLDDLGSHRAHAAYLGYLNLVLSVRRVVDPVSPTEQLSDRISAHLHRRLAATPTGLLQTYPGEVYPVDNAAVVASLALHQRVSNASHDTVLARWDASFDRMRDPDTGLLYQSLVPGSWSVLDGPRGSGSGLAAYFLSFGRADQSRALYEAIRDELVQSLLGFEAVREYPRGVAGTGDIDSGPVLLGVSISSTGFALAGSRIHRDDETHRRLWSTAYLFGAPLKMSGGGRHFAFGGPLGDAMIFALLTARPAATWSERS